MSTKHEAVLSFHDSILYESDVNLLDGPHWLNDSIIGFYMEYLENEVYNDMGICFLRPEITQCLKLSPPAELPLFLDPINFRDKSLAVMPLNDCDNPSEVGGSHWSLLVYCKNENSFYHLDSSQGSNVQHARIVAAKISYYLGGPHTEPVFRTPNSLQQSNSYDCGVFVLCNMDLVIKFFLRHKTLQNLGVIRIEDVIRKRPELKALVLSLSDKT